ncbi:MAG: NAD(P)/FAD-dependent oxidoreductase [Eubacteriaceae bacterium]|nr:NAD(P)/FAD-dependent oxidoreductase [Eubacteriaceae bacterium]
MPDFNTTFHEDGFSALTDRFDLVVIGGGMAGIRTACASAGAGLKTALIVKDGRALGGRYLRHTLGLCYLHAFVKTTIDCQNAGRMGIRTSGLNVDLNQTLADQTRVITAYGVGLDRDLINAGVTVIEGTAYPKQGGRVDITQDGTLVRSLSADRVVLAVGSRHVKHKRHERFDRVLSDDDITHPNQIPGDLVIAGSGAAACEIACIYARLGSRVTIITKADHVLEGIDAQIVGRLEEQMKKVDIVTHTKSTVVDVYKDSLGSIHIEIEQDSGKRETLFCSDVYLIPKAQPRLETLEDLPLVIDDGKIAVDESMRTNIDGIYAVGSAVRGGTDISRVTAQARALVAALTGGETARVSDYLCATTLRTIPEIACVGLTDKQARAFYKDVRIGLAPLGADGKGLLDDKKQGFVKVIADGEYSEILGVHMIGDDALELIGQAQAIIAAEGTLQDFDRYVLPAPGLSGALYDAISKVEVD